MPALQTILSAKQPLTLSGVPAGFLPSLLADLARAGAGARCVFVAPDEAAMRAIASTAPFFAPELEVVQFPAWDCLPYDRASPTLRVMAERVAALHRLQAKAKGAQLVLTTATAVTQRVLTPFRIRQLVATLAPGERIGPRRPRDPAGGRTAMSGPTPSTTRANIRCAAGWSTCSLAARNRRCGSTSSATRSRASVSSTPPTSAPSAASTASPCCPRRRRCSTRRR